MYTKSAENENLNVIAFDHWLANTRQGVWFTTSSLHAMFDIISKKPKWITLISDNRSHYDNSEMMHLLAYTKHSYGIEVRSWIFLTAGEAKTAINSHPVQIRSDV